MKMLRKRLNERRPVHGSLLFLKELEKRHRDEDDDKVNIPNILPVLPLKDTVVFPFAVQPLGAGQDRSIRLIEAVMRGNRLVVLVAQKSAEIELAGPNDIFKVGTVARIARMFRMPDGTLQIIVQGLERVDIGKFMRGKPYLTAHISLRPEIQESDDETEAIKRNVVGYFQRLMMLAQNVREDLAAATLNLEEARQVAYVITSIVQMEMEMKQKILEVDSVRAKLESLSSYLAHELDIFELGRKIQTSAQEEMGKVQREYLLREQLKAIQRELGEESEEQATSNELRRKIEEAMLPEEALKEANRELSRLEKMPTASPEYSMIRTYLELLTSLPWSKSTGAKIDVPYARQVLDHDHYDLEKIKGRILEYLAVRRLKDERLAEQAERDREMDEAEQQGEDVENKTSYAAADLAGSDAPDQPRADPVFRGTSGRGQDLAGTIDCAGAGPQIRANVAGRHSRRGRDSRASPHLYRIHAGAHHSNAAARGSQRPGYHAGRGGQGRSRLARRPLLGAAGSARPRTELQLPR